MTLNPGETNLKNSTELPRGLKSERREIALTIFPASLWMLVFVAVPLALVIAVSFLTRGIYGDIEYHFTLANYIRLFDPLYVKILLDSLLLTSLTTLLCLLFAYPFAYIVARSSDRWRPLLLMLIIVPFWTNSLVRTYAWITLLRTEGIINSYLLHLGLISQPLPMLYNQGAVLVGLVYALFPFMVLPLYATIQKLDYGLLEAAGDLGANPWKAFLQVTLPLSMPGIIAGSLLVFIPSLGYFFIPDLMGGSKIMLISNLIKNQFLTARDWPFGSALSILLIFITLILISFYLRAVGRGQAKEVLK